MSENKVALGIIGGSGLYSFEGLENRRIVIVDTPPLVLPSSPVILGEVHGKQLAFLARHGIGHTISPSEVNYRANIYAMKQLGVQKLISVSACGSLREDYAPGHVVVPDQIFDFTHKRERSTFLAKVWSSTSAQRILSARAQRSLTKALREKTPQSTQAAHTSPSRVRAFPQKPDPISARQVCPSSA